MNETTRALAGIAITIFSLSFLCIAVYLLRVIITDKKNAKKKHPQVEPPVKHYNHLFK